MRSHIKSILIPTDFSESAERSLAVGMSIAKRQNADVTLLHVMENNDLIQPVELLLPGINLHPDMNTLMEKRLNDISKKLSKKAEIKVTGKVLSGHAYDQICKLAYDGEFDLIVIGMHGTSGIRKLFMGSDAYRIVKNASCPVLSVPGHWKKNEFRKVLFPIRLIPGALDKYLYARPIIEKNNSELFLLGLTDINDTFHSKEVIMLINDLKQKLKKDSIKFQTAYISGEDFPTEVLKTAEELNIDLVVLTTNLDYDWKSFFIGPFVQQVLNHSMSPVLSIKPSGELTEKVPVINLADQWGKTLDLANA